MQIGGPTGAFVVIVYGIVQQYGYDGLAVATLMAGVILIAMGLARLGGAIKFIPYPVTLGFTAGIALIIATQQVKDVLGLRMGAVPANFFEKIGAYAANAGTVNVSALLLAAAAVALIGVLAARLVAAAESVRGAGGVHGGGAAGAPRRRDGRVALRRDLLPVPACRTCRSVTFAELRRLVSPGDHDRAAGGDREPALGGGGRRHDRAAPPLEHGAHRAGGGEHRVAALRRDPGHRRDRAHGDEHPERRPDAGRRDRPRGDAAADRALPREDGRR